ncbi:AAA family ATPase [Chryseobacterium sp.]|uniref:AAA family ATPase n=1 Tax=Chryseobacterium sp. TaxID=1871047 RepID=UPI0025C491DA|nr:AAA family ATPase [Chryseobacterium sp.]MBV8327807.1 AAA family ATPase [Chryseobacterium sp.]
MNKNIPELYIITGGPGAGKTTLLEELNKRGFITVPEEGRRIIREQLNTGGNGLPWMNKKLFADLMFKASVHSYQEINRVNDPKITFFDRGILDTIGYLRLEQMPVSEAMKSKARQMVYQNRVFILPPWKEIYENDPERKQTPEEAEHTFNIMKETYTEYGYHVIEVPKVSVEYRADFILESIAHQVRSY